MKLKEDWGYAEVVPRQKIPAGRHGTWNIIYHAGTNGIPVGGGLRIIPPQFGTIVWEVGKVTAYTDQLGVFLEVHGERAYPLSFHHSNYPVITVIVYGRAIEPGKTLRVVMGDTGGYVSGRFIHARAQDHAANSQFRVFVDPIGNARFALEAHQPGRYRPVSGELSVEVVADKPSRFRLSLRHPPADGMPAAATLTVEDPYENVVRDFDGKVKLEPTTPIAGLPDLIELTPGDRGHTTFTFPAPRQEAPVYIAAVDWEHELIGTSNPLQPGFHAQYNAYFGELHVMTGQGGNPHMLGDTEEAILYARDDRGLDFTAVTNNPTTWEADSRLFAKYNAPHRFVTMPASELGFNSGHKNVYVLDESQGSPGAADCEQLWQSLKGRTAMVISHHPNTHSETDPYAGWGPHNLDTINPEFERVIEICQNRGSFERDEVGREGVHFGGFGSSVQDTLARDLRLGFVGGTDNHRARPASKRSNQSGLDADEFLTGGMTCVLAEQLTRQAVFEAIWHRRCYATTSVRVLLDFRVNGRLMGEEFKATGQDARAPRTIAVRAAGTTDIARAVIVRNAHDVYTHPGTGRLLQFEWHDEQPIEQVVTPDGRWVYYYVRLVLSDGNMAWASPVWIDL